MARIRPAGSGRATPGITFMRTTGVRPGLVVTATAGAELSGWPTTVAGDIADMNLNHVVGWVAEIRSDGIHLLNPLCEGVLVAQVDDPGTSWNAAVTAESAVAVLIINDEPDEATTQATQAVRPGDTVLAGTVRAALSERNQATATPGRNEPCSCGSGRKYKHCHGR